MHTTTTIVVLALCGLAAVQASAIGRKDVEGKDTVEATNNGITLKSGYEGYIHAPTTALAAKRAESRKDTWFSTSQLDLMKALIMYQSSFLPSIGVKIVKIFVHFVVALFIGITATTAVCSFTPLCSISFNGSKPAFLSDKKEVLPALKEALEAVSRIPNFFKKEQSPAQVQPEPLLEIPKETLQERQEQIVDPRNPQKNVDDQSRSLKSNVNDVKDNKA